MVIVRVRKCCGGGFIHSFWDSDRGLRLGERGW